MALFTARQPIFDARTNLVAYELLYRNKKKQKSAEILDESKATSLVMIQSMMVSDYTKISSNKKVFIKFTKELIVFEAPKLLNKESIVIEIFSELLRDTKVLKCIKELKDEGYLIAIDEVVDMQYKEQLLEYADIVKVDFVLLNRDRNKIEALTKELRECNVKLLAKKLESKEDFEYAKSLQYDYFQGFFFAKPDIVENKDIEIMTSTKVRLINELQKEDPDNNKLAQIVTSDPSVTLKLLKLLNSVAFYKQREITSVKEAIIIIGLKEFRKWLMLLMLQDMNNSKPTELITTSLIRARFMEIVVQRYPELKVESDTAFLSGMLSMIDALTDCDMSEALTQLSLSTEIINAIEFKAGNAGSLLTIIEKIERGKVKDAEKLCSELGLSSLSLEDIYLQAVTWVNFLIH